MSLRRKKLLAPAQNIDLDHPRRPLGGGTLHHTNRRKRTWPIVCERTTIMIDLVHHSLPHCATADESVSEPSPVPAASPRPPSSPLHELRTLGQSIWLDELRRSRLSDGTLARLVGTGDVTGVTSNPAVFEQALADSNDSDTYLAELRSAASGSDPKQALEQLALSDARAAADLLRPCFDASHGAEGYVSLDLSPHLADSSAGTVIEGRRLWRMLNRPNAMIKVPATEAGLVAIKTLLAEGINIHVSLLFGLERYRQVVNAFFAGLEQRYAGDPNSPAPTAVAGFGVGDIDRLVDAELDARNSDEARALRGQAAITAARQVWSEYQYWTGRRRWQRLAAHGVRPKRLCWTTTSTTHPIDPPSKYIEALIGADTIAAMTPATLDVYRASGQPGPHIGDEPAEAIRIWQRLQALGISAADIAERAQREAIDCAVQAFDQTLARIERLRAPASIDAAA